MDGVVHDTVSITTGSVNKGSFSLPESTPVLRSYRHCDLLIFMLILHLLFLAWVSTTEATPFIIKLTISVMVRFEIVNAQRR